MHLVCPAGSPPALITAVDHGADAAVLAERELAYSLADMVMATPPYRPARVEADAAG